MYATIVVKESFGPTFFSLVIWQRQNYLETERLVSRAAVYDHHCKITQYFTNLPSPYLHLTVAGIICSAGHWTINLDNLTVYVSPRFAGCRSAVGGASSVAETSSRAPIPSEWPLPVHPSIGRGQPQILALLLRSLPRFILLNTFLSIPSINANISFSSLQKGLSHVTFEKKKQTKGTNKKHSLSNSSQRKITIRVLVISLSTFYTTCKYIFTEAFIVISFFISRRNPAQNLTKCTKSEKRVFMCPRLVYCIVEPSTCFDNIHTIYCIVPLCNRLNVLWSNTYVTIF